MKYRVLLLLSAMFFFLSCEDEPSPIKVEQTNSSLKVQWDKIKVKKWQILDESGNECAQGKVKRRAKSLDISKLSFDKPRTLNLFTKDGKQSFQLNTKHQFSPLLKVHRNAVIYQLPVRTWAADGVGEGLSGHLNTISNSVLKDIKSLGVDYLWVTGIIESISSKQTDPDIVKGNAGSYYAIHDSWDVNEEIGGLKAFEQFIERAHKQGLRVMVDLVPNHTARNHKTDVICKNLMDFGLDDNKKQFFVRNNNYYYLQNTKFTPPGQPNKEGADGRFDTDIFKRRVQYESPAKVTGNNILDPNPSIHTWFETVKLNYGYNLETNESHYRPTPSTWIKVLDIAKYWTSKGVDGFRVDFAHSVPIEFWRYFSHELKKHYPQVFLLAEAYETDLSMKLPGYSNLAMLQAGFDSIYFSELYWGVRHGNMNEHLLSLLENPINFNGKGMTNYIENHDETRVASTHFAPHIEDTYSRAQIGLHISTAMALMPNHFLIHGGQELMEEADIFGTFAGDNGKTSIFDFVYQPKVKQWRQQESSEESKLIRSAYQKLFQLKRSEPFNKGNHKSAPSFIDLTKLNIDLGSNNKILSYLRYHNQEKYLVVLNSDLHSSHNVTIHFTKEMDQDTNHALSALEISNDESWYVFEEVLYKQGWVPYDPAFEQEGVPGWALYKPNGVPSGLHLGDMAPGQAYVFKMKTFR